MTEPLVYVLVLNYRAWQDTVVCLAALQKCSYLNFRVLVIDNASDNDSVQQIGAQFPKLELLVLPQNLGFAGGNNVGIRLALEAGAKYVWLLNPDTEAGPQALAEMVKTAESDPKIGAVGSVLLEFDNPTQVQAWGGGEVVLGLGLIRLLSDSSQRTRLSYISGASLLIPSQVLSNIGLLDEGFFMYGEDADFGLRVGKAGYRLEVAESAKVLHKGGTSWGGFTLASDEHFAVYNTRLFHKHAPFPRLAVAGYGVFWTLEYSLRRRWQSIAVLWRGIARGWHLPIEEKQWMN